jgi:gliding motility-associated-like protein
MIKRTCNLDCSLYAYNMSTKKNLFIGMVCCIFQLKSATGQNENYNWYFGDHTGLTFKDNNINLVDYSAISQPEGSASVSDHLGNLLFYTDGITVWNACHIPMDNGTGLRSHWSAKQAATIVPKPGSSFLYYIFTNDAPSHYSCGPCDFSYSIVDMEANNGLGKVIQKNQILFEENSESCCVGIDQDSCGLWIISQANFKGIYSFHLTSNGIEDTVLSTPSSPSTFNTNYLSFKMSPANNKIIATDAPRTTLYDFDPATGIVSNPQILISRKCYDGEFSPNGNIVYINSDLDGTFQYDLTSSSPGSTELQLSSSPAAGLEIAPNGIIVGVNSTGIFKIDAPNNLGYSCNYNILFNHINPIIFSNGFPNNINTSCFNVNRTKIARVCGENKVEVKSDDPFDLALNNINLHDKFLSTITLPEGTCQLTISKNDCTQNSNVESTYNMYTPKKVENTKCDFLNNACSILENTTNPVNGYYIENFAPENSKFYSFPYSCSISGWYRSSLTDLKFPNIITPNGDGINDIFLPIDTIITENMSIIFFNRWGNEVGKLNSNANEIDNAMLWNKVNKGIYFYIVQGDCFESVQGFLHVIKE